MILEQGALPVVNAYAEHINCHRGCSDCCSQKFSVSELEGELLRVGLTAIDEATREDIVNRARGHEPGTPCPVLGSDRSCRLYAHRPRICRKYGIPLWDPENPQHVRTCPLNFKGVQDLDSGLIVEPQAAWAADWIETRRELGLGVQENRTIAGWLAATDET